MAARYLLYLLGLAAICTVSCQQPIVEDIEPEVKRMGESGYLNCTVSRQQNNKVVWIQPLEGLNENWISSDTEILAKNTVVNGKQKYTVERQYRSNDRITYMLVVNRLREEDGGRYKCTVYMQGTEKVYWPYKYGNMTVQVPPAINLSQTSNTQQRHQGDSVTLRCNATGVPTPNITWIRADGRPLPDGRLSHRGHELRINNIQREDGGPYRCVADNNVIPPAHHDVKLVVFSSPEASAVHTRVGQAANRRFHALLKCTIKGTPHPNLTWYKVTDGVEVIINDDDKYDINQFFEHTCATYSPCVGFWLRIRNVQANDYGVYFCEGTNVLGSDRANVTLYETSVCQGPDCPTGT